MAIASDVVIVSAARTAVGRAGRGTLKNTRPDDLAAAALRGVIERLPEFDLDAIDDVIIGCATHEGPQGYNVARIASLRAGFPVSVPALTINRFCASGFGDNSDGSRADPIPGVPKSSLRVVWKV